jgi:hypothetical protein
VADLDSKYREHLEARQGSSCWCSRSIDAAIQTGPLSPSPQSRSRPRRPVRPAELKLMLMRGEGKLLGKLGGGETQRQGLEALGEWFSGIEA